MQLSTQTAQYEQVTFEVREGRHILVYNQHEMGYQHPQISLREALQYRGFAIPEGAHVRVTPKDDAAREVLAQSAWGIKQLSIEDRVYELDC